MKTIPLVRSCLYGLILALAGCMTDPPNPNPRAADPLPAVTIDLNRYMGRWYNIANIPYFGERNYVASYSEWSLRPDGQIDDLYVGRKGGFDQPETRRTFVDTVVPDTGNALWRVHLFWPISVSQQTVYVDPQYQFTLLAYPGKSLGWIFARTPDISERDYQDLLARLSAMGYDTARFLRVPQRPDQIGQPGFQSPAKD